MNNILPNLHVQCKLLVTFDSASKVGYELTQLLILLKFDLNKKLFDLNLI